MQFLACSEQTEERKTDTFTRLEKKTRRVSRKEEKKEEIGEKMGPIYAETTFTLLLLLLFSFPAPTKWRLCFKQHDSFLGENRKEEEEEEVEMIGSVIFFSLSVSFKNSSIGEKEVSFKEWRCVLLGPTIGWLLLFLGRARSILCCFNGHAILARTHVQ